MSYERDQLTSEAATRLAALETALRPSNLLERVRAFVLGDATRGLDPEDMDDGVDLTSSMERHGAIARELGKTVAADHAVLEELLLDIVRGGHRTWEFGRGMAAGSPHTRAAWAGLVEALDQVPLKQRNVSVLCGFLAELWLEDRGLAEELLDSAVDQPALVPFLPALHAAVNLNARGVERLTKALRAGQVPVWMFRNLSAGRAADQLAGGVLKDLLLLLADQPDGFDVALEILYMRLFAERRAKRKHDPEILEAGRELLQRVTFPGTKADRSDHQLADVVEACLGDPDTAPIAAETVVRLRKAVSTYQTYWWHHQDLLKSLLKLQAAAVLDVLFATEETDQRPAVHAFNDSTNHRGNPADAISCEALIAWCERDRDNRYPLAASIVTFARRTEETGPQGWSEEAKALFVKAPDPRSVLAVFIERLRPVSWSGSRAAVMEANAQLLDSVEPYLPADLMPYVREAKAQLAAAIARERRHETEGDGARDERFE